MQSRRAPKYGAVSVVPANTASLEEKNKTGGIRESRIEKVAGSLNLQAIFTKFYAAALSQRDFALWRLPCAYARACQTDLSIQICFPARNIAVCWLTAVCATTWLLLLINYKSSR